MTLEAMFSQFVYGVAFGSGLIVSAAVFAATVGWRFCG